LTPPKTRLGLIKIIHSSPMRIMLSIEYTNVLPQQRQSNVFVAVKQKQR
jgi:hypothetical protein